MKFYLGPRRPPRIPLIPTRDHHVVEKAKKDDQDADEDVRDGNVICKVLCSISTPNPPFPPATTNTVHAAHSILVNPTNT